MFLIRSPSGMSISAGAETGELYLGGTTSIGKDLEEAEEVDRLISDDAFEFKQYLMEKYGLNLGADYAILYNKADPSLTGEEKGLGGVFRIYGRWTIVGRGTNNTGTLVAKVEHRHRLGGYVAPGRLAPELGYLGITGLGFTDVGWFLAPFYWEQFFDDGNTGFVAGRLDPTDFTDILGIGSQWNSFQNAAVLSNMSIAVPDLGCGFGAGKKLNDQWVVGMTVHDANGSQTEVECFDGGCELFKQAYVSWTPHRSMRFTNAFHFTLWHQDEREEKGTGNSYGVATSGNWLINDRWMPFFRWGLAHGDAPLAKQHCTLGCLINVPGRSDQIGIAGWWQDLSHRDLGEQSGIELFYRWDVFPNFSITPSLQVLNEPALHSEEDILLFGIRARMLFF